MATMTLAHVYGPWEGTGRDWSQEDHPWDQLHVSWDDQAITWAEALQPWTASISAPPVRILDVPAELRVGAVIPEQRILPVAVRS